MAEQAKVDKRQHLAGGRPWRWVFECMRAAQEAASLVPNLLLFSSNIVHCCVELPPEEVADDISLIVQTVSDRWLPIEDAEAARICRMTCTFVRNIFQRQQLQFNGDSRVAILHFFQGTITSASTVILLGEDGGAEAGRAKVEAVAALGQFLQQARTGGFLSMDDVSEVVLFLSGLMMFPVTPFPAVQSNGRSGSGGHQRSNNVDDMEVQRLTFVVMSSLISQARPLVSGESWTTATQALRTIIDSLVSSKELVEDNAASRYYLDLLRCVYVLVSKPEEHLKAHIGALMRALQMFFRYGLKRSQGDAASSNSNRREDEKATSRLFRKETFEFPANDGCACIPSSAELFSFDTHESESASVAAFHDKCSELRMYSICAIQALAKADPEGFQECSGFLLLTDDMAQSGSDAATLLTVLRFEPLTEVRMAAVATLAVMLEFPMYRFQHDADCLEDEREGLSDSQRRICLEIQTGLVFVILNEKHEDILVAALKALSCYISTTPFSQLPSELLPNIVLSICKRLRESNYFLNQSCILVASIICLKVSLTIPPSSTQLCDTLSKDAPTGLSNSALPPSLLVDLITYLQPPAPIAVQVEAILALKAAAHNYPVLVAPYWDDIFQVLVRIIDSGSEGQPVTGDDGNLLSSAFAKNVSPSGFVQSSRRSDDELVQSAIELLDELLRVVSDFESPREEKNDISLKSQRPETTGAPKLLPKLMVHNAALTSAFTSEQTEEDGSLQWILALERLLPGVLRHSSPMVRGAGFSCFEGLTPAVFCSLPAAKQEFILSAIMRASQYDDTPAVRSAACRAVGVIGGFPQVSKSNEQVTAFTELLILGMKDSLASERVTVSWALANLCDGLCSIWTIVDPTEADQFLERLPLVSLVPCVFKAAKDADVKVRVNGLRSLGSLSRILNFKTAPYALGGEASRCMINSVEFEDKRAATSSDLLGATVQTFLSYNASETLEIQRNLCRAVGKLLQNPSLQLATSPWAAPLLSLLQSLVLGSENLEVQMHAAGAVEVPVLRENYGASPGEILQNLARILHSLDATVDTSPANEPAATEQLMRSFREVLGLGASKDYRVWKDGLAN